MHKYWGFGLKIASALAMPELIACDFEEADTTITLGQVPQTLDGSNVVKRAFSIIGNNEYILEVKGTGRYYAGHGNAIIIEPVEGIDEHSVRLFLLGTMMAAILYQRGYIPLHASAIERNGKLTLFTGNSGAGKSTLLAHLLTKGYTVFTDDICVLHYNKDDDTVYGTASYPMIKLWEDSLNKIDHSSFGREFKIRPHLPKYGQFFHDSFTMEALPIEKIFVLQATPEIQEISYTQPDPLKAFKLIEKQAYRYRFATGDALRPIHFMLMSALTKHVPVVATKRPMTGITITDFSDLIESLL